MGYSHSAPARELPEIDVAMSLVMVARAGPELRYWLLEADSYLRPQHGHSVLAPVQGTRQVLNQCKVALHFLNAFGQSCCLGFTACLLVAY